MLALIRESLGLGGRYMIFLVWICLDLVYQLNWMLTINQKFMYLPLTLNYARREVVLGFKPGYFKNPPKSFILRWLRSIHAYLSIFMFQTCLNHGQTYDLTKIQMGIKKLKTSSRQAQVEKQVLDIFKPEKSCIYPLYIPKPWLMNSSMKRSGFWFQSWKFQKPSQELHFGVTN